MLNKVKNDFLAGLVIILPIFLTIAILGFLARQVNEKILNPMLEFFGLYFYNPCWTYAAKAVGFVITILFVVLIGAATRLILLRKFFGFWEKLLSRVPTIGKIYLTIKQISRAILGQGKHVFEKVVLLPATV